MYSCIPSHVKDRYGPHICEAIIECVDFDAIGPLKCKRRTARCFINQCDAVRSVIFRLHRRTHCKPDTQTCPTNWQISQIFFIPDAALRVLCVKR
ncbi:Uncharacterized protein HZ326_24865 [Fusarium oxysporum f. sp. albedinis]|nr:Uncharacterized protein HZ326_24865 [Fusarium oxysporum f. sp. albedinis]